VFAVVIARIAYSAYWLDTVWIAEGSEFKSW
jgi:hypothetical protein